MTYATKESNVAAAERELAVRLPTEYRQRLISVNGGELSTGGDDWVVFPVAESSQRARGRTQDIVAETRRARELDGFPSDAVAIASNTAGDLLVFLPAATGLDPQVQRWDAKTQRCTAVPLRFD